MSASLLAPDSTAAHRVEDLLGRVLDSGRSAGAAPARILAEYVLGRRCGELDVSGRPADGQFIAAEARAGAPHDIILVDDAQGRQARVLGELTHLRTYNDRIDEARIVAEALPDAEAIEELGASMSEAAGAARAADPVRSADAPGDTAVCEESETWAVVNAPKAVNALAEVVARIQPHVSVLIVIGRSDAMSRAVNKELARGFGRVDVSPGIGKYRMIIGSRPLSSPSLPSFPKHGTIDHPAVGTLQVCAHGACFSGVKSDEGSTLLLDALASETSGIGRRSGSGASEPPTPPRSVLDLGCGNGWLLTAAMRVTGAEAGVGVDVSKAAVASARATAEANGIDVDIRLADAATGAAEIDGDFDLILLNPPFHHGTAIDSETAAAMMRTASRLLAPGGTVLTVFNSHLRHRERLESLIGPSEQLVRNRRFTVIASRSSGK